MYSRMLVGVDGSQESMQALCAGLSLAKILDATVDVLLVIAPRHYAQFADREVLRHDPAGQAGHVSLLQQEENAILDAIRAAAADLGREVGRAQCDCGQTNDCGGGDPVHDMVLRGRE